MSQNRLRTSGESQRGLGVPTTAVLTIPSVLSITGATKFSPGTWRQYSTSYDPALPQWVTGSVAAVRELISESRDPDQATSLLLVLSCFLGDCDITVCSITRGAVAASRWSSNGELEALSPLGAGIDPSLSELLLTLPGLTRSIKLLEDMSLIRMTHDSTGELSFIVERDRKRLIKECLDSSTRKFWRCQALLLASFVFPRPHLDPQ